MKKVNNESSGGSSRRYTTEVESCEKREVMDEQNKQLNLIVLKKYLILGKMYLFFIQQII